MYKKITAGKKNNLQYMSQFQKTTAISATYRTPHACTYENYHRIVPKNRHGERLIVTTFSGKGS